MKEHTFFDDLQAFDCAVENAKENCICKELRKQDEYVRDEAHERTGRGRLTCADLSETSAPHAKPLLQDS